MENLCLFVRYEIWFLLLGFALVIAYQILTGKINTKGLLLDKETGKLSPGRVQLFTRLFNLQDRPTMDCKINIIIYRLSC
ncbi:MAG: hypothetical protein ACUZ77_03015 [Candidatus Brocadiales bacterium]